MTATKKFFFTLLLICTAGQTCSAHEGHHHGVESNVQKMNLAPVDIKSVYLKINKDYEATAQPIFEQKCAACHSNSVPAPWYSAVPGVHQLIESDRTEAKEHLEISNGFPFAGHGTPEDDLSAIRESIDKETMPTPLYTFMHPFSRLSARERRVVIKWIADSERKIAAVKNPEPK